MVQETLCSRCVHSPVCQYKSKFLQAVQAVNDVTIAPENHTIQRIRDIEFIKPVELMCRYYVLPQPMTRATTENNYGHS